MRRWIEPPAVKLLAVLAVALLIAAGVRWLLPADAARAPQQQNAAAAPQPGHQPNREKQGANAAPTQQRGAQSGQGKGPVPVLATAATTKDFPVIIRGLGSVQAFNTVTVKSRVDGQITQVAFQEGQYVHAGDLLVQIDPRPYQAQVEQATANKAKDQANLENAQRDLARLAALLQTQLAATRQQYDTQKALVAQLTAAVQADQAQIDAAKLNVEYSSVRSPIDGITGLRLVDVGNLVAASGGTPLVVVTQIKPTYVTFTVPERDLALVRQTMAKHPVTVLAFNGDDNQQLSEGRLTLVNNAVDQASGTVTLKSVFDNKDAALWPGAFINAHLVIDIVKNGVTLPAATVQMGPTGPFVYLIKPDNTVEARPVSVTQVESGIALLGKGLAAGDKVVASGQAGLTPGMQVAVQQGQPGEMNAKQPELGPEGVGSTGINTAPSGAGEIKPR
ncbi:MAG: efflux RND transporter periplasmic adaptor subunit [Alphaproteobacteria bacterium]|nr:efflux RND transporter periplasmic adaptor subunit [Alphaproteobacteria bacterium]